MRFSQRLVVVSSTVACCAISAVASAPPATTPRPAAPTTLGVAAGPRLADLLPTDPALVTGTLDNGLRYVIRRHAVPPDRATAWLHIHSGSLNETDRQRGIAHFLEHMAFNGSTNFAPGSLVPFFQSLGMTFGRDQNAFTSFDQTTYQLSLPDAKTETIDKGLTFFSDVMAGLSLLPTEIDSERQIIQEERRRSLSGQRRVSDTILARIAPGSIYGARLPIGTEQSIDGFTPQDFQDYYNAWYGPGNSTLIVVADADSQEVIKVIGKRFGSAPKSVPPTPQPVGIRPYEKSFAIIATDPEVRFESLRISRLEPARPPVVTHGQFRDALVEELGVSALNRRLSDKVAAGGTSYLSARVASGTDSNALYTAEMSARPAPGKWKEALNEMAMELQRARAFGFTAAELDDVRTNLISGSERAVETEATQPASSFVNRINNNVASGEPTMSAQQRLELSRTHLPTITAEEVATRFAKEFEPSAVAFVAVLRPDGAVPSEEELLALGVKALQVQPTRDAERARATELLSQLPTAGKVGDGSLHTPTGVWSGWLDNNVRVHHRFMDERKNAATVQINLIGGELLETGANKGITQAAQLAFSRPATKHLSSTDIRQLMTGKKVSVGGAGGGGGGRGRGGRGGGGGGGNDGISLSISGSPEELETGFQLAYLLLTEPMIEEVAFDQFLTSTREGLEETQRNPSSLGARIASAAPYPADEPRTRPLAPADLDRLDRAAAQSWLEKLIRESPIEVVIVGDLDRQHALDLTAKYLGALPQRAKVDASTYESLRHLKRPTGPRVTEQTLLTPTPQAYVSVGFYGADETNRADARALSMASRILSTRMVKEVREDAQLVYSIGANSRAASTYPGFGVFSASAPTDPPKVAALVEKLQSMYTAFAEKGPTAEELAVAKKQMENTFAQQVVDPGYWSGRLNQLTFRGASLDDIAKDPEAYQAITAEQIRDAFRRYWAKENSIVVVVRPERGSAGAGK